MANKLSQPATDRLSETAARNTLAINPIIGISKRDFVDAAKVLVGSAIKKPVRAAKHFGAYLKALGAVASGVAEMAPEPKDKRFADPAWQTSALHKRMLQAHATTGTELARYINESDMDERDKARANLFASIMVDAIAPSNTPTRR